MLAGAAIGASEILTGQRVSHTTMYALVASALMWLSIALFVLGGQRAARGLDTAREWLIENAGPVTFVVAAVFGLLFTGQAVVVLIT